MHAPPEEQATLTHISRGLRETPPTSRVAHVASLPRDEHEKEKTETRTGRWTPSWGNGGPFAVGDAVLYRNSLNSLNSLNSGVDEDSTTTGFSSATVLAVDLQCDPPSYVVDVAGTERHTSAERLAPPPDPTQALCGGVASDDAQTADAAVAAESVNTTNAAEQTRRTKEGLEIENSGPASDAGKGVGVSRKASDDTTAFAVAHELVIRAAGFLDPNAAKKSGDRSEAVWYLKRALQALEAPERVR